MLIEYCSLRQDEGSKIQGCPQKKSLEKKLRGRGLPYRRPMTHSTQPELHWKDLDLRMATVQTKIPIKNLWQDFKITFHKCSPYNPIDFELICSKCLKMSVARCVNLVVTVET